MGDSYVGHAVFRWKSWWRMGTRWEDERDTLVVELVHLTVVF